MQNQFVIISLTLDGNVKKKQNKKKQTRYDVNKIIFPYTVDKHTFNNFSSQCILSRVSAVDSGNNNAQSDYST